MGGIKDNRALFISLQIIGGLVIVFILYVVTLLVLNTDALVIDTDAKVKQKESTTIVKGKASAIKLSKREYNTINPHSESFKKLARSINRYGGAQFTYQFWMKVTDPSDEYFKDLVILSRGDNRQFKTALYNPSTGERISSVNNLVSDGYVIKCPLIKFGNSYRDIVVEFNSNKTPDTRIEVTSSGDTPINRTNVLSLTPQNWFLITVAFEDSFSHASGTENGIVVSFYINDFKYPTRPSAESLLRGNFIKQNDGNLYLFPDIKEPKEFLQLGNLTYYNYAVSQADVSAVYSRGPPTFEMTDADDSAKDKATFLTAYNKIDLYNY
jgi:hypothetical protein